MASIGKKLFAILPGSSHQKLAVAILPVGAAGAFGVWYAAGEGSWIALFAYASCLSVALLALHPVSMKLADGLAENGGNCTDKCNASRSEFSSRDCEDASLSALSETKVERVNKPAGNRQTMAGSGQHVLDLDGMNALQAMRSITGNWLVESATVFAVNAVRASCLARLDPDESEYVRVQRWFDIVVALKGADKLVLPKAELRRASVAREMGVSEEQIRQIDQGRYQPLNKVLARVDPKSL
jgi:hypothetical protein